jgi:hypothetical protein
VSTPETMRAVDRTLARLEALGSELERQGWRTRLVVQAGRVPCLRVTNPEPGAAALTEHIYYAPKGDAWTFWWSWAEPIAIEVPDTADIIVRVLRSAGG